MKPTVPVLLLMCAAAHPAGAAPFTLRPLPAGYDAKVVNNAGRFFSPVPVVVDIGTGRPVWYGGGSNFSTYPYTSNPLGAQFTVDLPALTIPNFPASLEKPQAGVPCDVDGDGDMDLLRINSWSGFSQVDTFQVFLNNGSGTFSKGYRQDTTYPVADGLINRHYHIDAADFDRDGDPDVAILMAPDEFNNAANRYDGTLTIRWNDGTGQFPTSTVLRSSGFSVPAALALGDVDNDGDMDLLCDAYTTISGGLATNSSLIFRNSGTGTFTMFNEGTLRPARLADLNRDGWLDAGYGNRTGLNNGAGSIADITLGSNFAGTAIKDYAYADADGDGKLDLVTNNASNLVYFKGDATGDFPAIATVMVALPSPAAAIGAGDSDRDGDTDFFLNLNNGTSALVENRSLHLAAGGTLAGGAAISSASVPGVTELHAADFDLDGRQDLLAVSPSQKKLWVMFGTDGGAPSAPVLFRSLASAPNSAAVADFDLDGRPDVAYTVPGTGEVRMARNTPGLLPGWPDSAIATGLAGVSLLRTGNLGTPNGRTDLLTGNGTTGQVRWLYQSGATWNGQNVLNSFAPAPGALLAANMASRPGDEVIVLAADASNLLLRSYQLNPTWVSLGSHLSTPVSTSPLAEVLAWADVTGDARNEIVFLKGDGSPGFWNPLTGMGGGIGAADSAIRAIASVDWDRDGRPDLLCATANGVSLFTWKGAWTQVKLLTEGSSNSIVPMDINRDGWMDAAVGDPVSGSVTFLTNSPRVLAARQTPAPEVTLVTGLPGSTVAFAATSQGRPADTSLGSLADANAVVSRAEVYFHRAVASGPSWTKGPAMTPAEVNQIVSSLALMSGNTVIANGNPGTVNSGRVVADNAAGGGTLVPITPGSTQQLNIRLTLTPGASQSPNARFFLELKSDSSLRGYPQDSVSTSTLIPLSGVQPVLVNIIPALTVLQQWRLTNFGTWESTGNAANDADPDGDGNSNLVEYLMGQVPTTAGGIGSSSPIGLTLQGQSLPMVADLRLLTSYDSRIRLTIQQSTGPGTWTTLSQRTGTAAWTGTIPSSNPLSGGRTRFNFNTVVPAFAPRYFLRLLAEKLP